MGDVGKARGMESFCQRSSIALDHEALAVDTRLSPGNVTCSSARPAVQGIDSQVRFATISQVSVTIGFAREAFVYAESVQTLHDAIIDGWAHIPASAAVFV